MFTGKYSVGEQKDLIRVVQGPPNREVPMHDCQPSQFSMWMHGDVHAGLVRDVHVPHLGTSYS